MYNYFSKKHNKHHRMMKEIVEPVEHQLDSASIETISAGYRQPKDEVILNSYDHFHNDFQDTFISSSSSNYSGIFNISSIINQNINKRPFNIDINQNVDRYFIIDSYPINNYEDNDGLPGGEQSAPNQHTHQPNTPILLESYIAEAYNSDTDKANQNCSDETKNIPKNFIKAIFSYILQNKDNMVERVLREVDCEGEMQRFMEFIGGERKIKKYTIERLKNWWTCGRYGKAMRVIWYRFLRKRSLSYIMTSKIEKKNSHLKYRLRFVRSMQRPQDFTNIK